MKSFKTFVICEDIVKLPSGKFMLLSPDGVSMGVFDTRHDAAQHQREIDFYSHLQNESSDIEERCWDGYKPTPGKKAYTKGSCVKETEDDLHEDAEYDGKKVTLNKPFRTPDGPKKFAVYVKNDKGNVVKVTFGDPNMEIKRDDSERRANYRARHNCSDPGPKWKANYWSCKMWSSKPVSKVTEDTDDAIESFDPSPSVSQAAKLFSKFLRTTGAPDKVNKFVPNSKGVFIGKSTKFNYTVDVKSRTVTSQALSSNDTNTYVWDDKTNRVNVVEAKMETSYDFDILDGPKTKRKVGAISNIAGHSPEDALTQYMKPWGYRKTEIEVKGDLIVVKAQWGSNPKDTELFYYRVKTKR